jgi:CRISPR system Cascade subunit CasE
MYLSRWTLRKNEILEHRMYEDYRIHQTVYSLFPFEGERHFLYSAVSQNFSSLVILIQSESKPVEPGFGRLEVKVIPENFFDCGKYLFQVKFSPVVQSVDGKDRPVKSESELVTWLKAREDGWGISIDYERILKVGDGTMVMRQKGNSNRVTVSYVELTGLLSVTDRDKFMKTVKSGIGRSKGFGFGLLQLKPIFQEEKDGRE